MADRPQLVLSAYFPIYPPPQRTTGNPASSGHSLPGPECNRFRHSHGREFLIRHSALFGNFPEQIPGRYPWRGCTLVVRGKARGDKLPLITRRSIASYFDLGNGGSWPKGVMRAA